jgi:hypothetical protein
MKNDVFRQKRGILGKYKEIKGNKSKKNQEKGCKVVDTVYNVAWNLGLLLHK